MNARAFHGQLFFQFEQLKPTLTPAVIRAVPQHPLFPAAVNCSQAINQQNVAVYCVLVYVVHSSKSLWPTILSVAVGLCRCAEWKKKHQNDRSRKSWFLLFHLKCINHFGCVRLNQSIFGCVLYMHSHIALNLPLHVRHRYRCKKESRQRSMPNV